MRPGLVMFALLVLPLAFAANNTGATGGYITGVNLSIDQPFSYWYFFYGNATGASSTLLFNNTSTVVYFSTTQNIYLISDTAFPFGGPFVVPNLSDVDAHYHLPGIESASAVFNDTSSFTLTTTTGAAAGTLDLPTLYIPGSNDTHAFREGIVQAGSSYIFVIPRLTALGLDNNSYDYQFFLPYYDSSGPQTFYTFSVVPPTTAATTTPSGTQMQALNYNWDYHDGQLDLSTEPSATVVLVSELGQSYTFRADQAGQILALLAPGRYTMQISKIGFISMTDNLYIPAAVTPLPPQTPPTTPPQAPTVTVTSTPEGNLICFGTDCYLQEAGGEGSLQALTELSCTGSICRLVGVNQTLFVQKHGLTPYSSGLRGNTGAGGPLNFSRMLGDLGRGLSQQFGPSGTSNSGILVLFALAALIGAGAFLHFRGGGRPRRGGYD